MAVAIVMGIEGATLDQYDEVVAKMGFVPGGPGADGARIGSVGAQPWLSATVPTGTVITPPIGER